MVRLLRLSFVRLKVIPTLLGRRALLDHLGVFYVLFMLLLIDGSRVPRPNEYISPLFVYCVVYFVYHKLYSIIYIIIYYSIQYIIYIFSIFRIFT